MENKGELTLGLILGWILGIIIAYLILKDKKPKIATIEFIRDEKGRVIQIVGVEQ